MDGSDEQVALCIVGAGPASLALLLRVAHASCNVCGSTASREAAQHLLARTVVVDASGGFLALWRRKLASQGVSHLRSPTFVHPHASRLIDDALLAFATSHGRRSDLQLFGSCHLLESTILPTNSG